MSDWRRLAGELAAWTCGQGPRLVFVHGFTQTANSWKPIAARFASDGYESIVVDQPGHGDSAEVRTDLA
ncbi:MAG: alpha/beta fold hydrolase, partial [Ilumatobacteraceae bacterium]